MTILERGITSTRWRDYVDIVQLARQGIDTDDLLRSKQAAARYRGVTLEPVAPYVVGYGQVGQAKWAAWGRRNGWRRSVSRARPAGGVGGLSPGSRVQPRATPPPRT